MQLKHISHDSKYIYIYLLLIYYIFFTLIYIYKKVLICSYLWQWRSKEIACTLSFIYIYKSENVLIWFMGMIKVKLNIYEWERKYHKMQEKKIMKFIWVCGLKQNATVVQMFLNVINTLVDISNLHTGCLG